LVTVRVISSDKTINQVAANTTIKPDGSWGTSFPDTWGTRADLEIFASTTDGSGGSTLPLIVATWSHSGSGSVFNVQGSNWPPNTKIRPIIYARGSVLNELPSVTSSASGTFSLSANMAGVPSGKGNYLLLETNAGTLSAQLNN
jgi:hypothetical protein